LLLVLKNLSVIEVSGLIVLAILTSLVSSLLLLRGKGSLIVLHRAIVLSQLARDNFFDLIDEADSTIDLLLVDAWVLVRLILVIVHQLVEVAQISLERGPGGFHEVLGASNGLTWLCISDLIDLVPQTLDSILCISVVFLKLISAHSLLIVSTSIINS
jgi:hypothetical protein